MGKEILDETEATQAEQIIKKLRDADADDCGGQDDWQVCQTLEVSEQTFHRWRNQLRRHEGWRGQATQGIGRREQRLRSRGRIDLGQGYLQEALKGNY